MSGPFDKAKKIIKNIAKSNTVVYQREFSLDMATPIARDTPVDTGRATANWQAGINQEPRANPNIFDKTPSASPTINKMRSDLSGLKFKDEVVIKNSVISPDEATYILKLENGGSKQAPNGMFLKNVVRYKQIASKTRKRLGL